MAGIRKNPFFLVIFFMTFLFLTSFNLTGQEKSDIGIFTGTSYYMGDINPSVHYKFPTFALGPIYRYNFNLRNSVRGHVIYHGLRGNDPAYNGLVSPGGSTEFDAKFVNLGLDWEFNWEPYRTANRKTKSSPYVFAGIGYGLNIIPSGLTKSHVNIPFGIGYKINLGRWLSGGIEASARKTFTDYVDDGTINGEADVLAPFGNDDWYFFTGVFVTYKFLKFWEDCPAMDE